MRAVDQRAIESKWKRSDDCWNQLLFNFDRAEMPVSGLASPANDCPLSKFALRFAAALEAEPCVALGNVTIRQLAQEVFGNSAGYARDAYDAAEAGFNIYLNQVRLDLSNPTTAIGWLLTQQSRLPLQSRRDQRQVDFQQFSTPPARSAGGRQGRGVTAGMAVLEPSAGTGNIAVLARLAGAHVDTNEIDPRRRQLLALQGFDPTALRCRAARQSASWRQALHAIVMNPPFSATGGRVNGTSHGFRRPAYRTSAFAAQAGRTAGCHRGLRHGDGSAGVSSWWAAIGERYQMRANIGIDGSEYARFGTTFDNQIIVIDSDRRDN